MHVRTLRDRATGDVSTRLIYTSIEPVFRAGINYLGFVLAIGIQIIKDVIFALDKLLIFPDFETSLVIKK